MTRPTGVALVVALLAPAARADEPVAVAPPPSLEPQLQQLQQQVAGQAARIKQLEAEQAQVAELEARVRQAQLQIDRLTERGSADAPVEALSAVPKLRPVGYVDVGWTVDTDPGRVDVRLHELLVGAEADLGERFDAEVSLAGGPQAEGSLAVDSAVLGAALTEHMRLQAGLLYVPLGYWNHHYSVGDFSAVNAERPLAISANSYAGAVAARQVGVNAEGAYVLGTWQLGWHLGVGSGHASGLTSIFAETARVWDPASWFQLWVQTPGGLQIGSSTSYERLSYYDYNDLGSEWKEGSETVEAVHIAWLRRRTELLAEAFFVLHGVENGETQYNRSGFVQWSHRARRTTPFARVELLERWKDDPVYQVYGGTRSIGELKGGARIDLSPSTAVRAELGLRRGVDYGGGGLSSQDASGTTSAVAGIHLVAGL